MPKSKQAYANYQSRSLGFEVGDSVISLIGGAALHGPFEGTVVALYPAIGQADVQLPHGSQRFPVEDLILNPYAPDIVPGMFEDSVPGGAGTVRVPGGPPAEILVEELDQIMRKEARVAERYIRRKAMYWHGRDRQYRATRGELESGKYCCPRCSDSPTLVPAVYKRREGSSVKLLNCQGCSFLIKYDDIHGV